MHALTTKAVWTIGHSTRTADDFLSLLRASRIDRLADIRTIPQSRRHPHFGSVALAARLESEGLQYRHFRDLGGLRKPRPDSPNGAWRHQAFRGYADHMMTPAFAAALDDLLTWAADGADGPDHRDGPDGPDNLDHPDGADDPDHHHGGPDNNRGRVAVMCAEAVWWRCHRMLLSDALVARGVTVRHILGPGSIGLHKLTPFAAVRADSSVWYPGLV